MYEMEQRDQREQMEEGSPEAPMLYICISGSSAACVNFSKLGPRVTSKFICVVPFMYA